MHGGKRLLAFVRGLVASPPSADAAPGGEGEPAGGASPAEALVAFMFLLLVIQSYWVFVLTRYVDLLESAGHAAIVTAGPERDPGGGLPRYPHDPPGEP